MSSKDKRVTLYDYNEINEVDIESRYNLYIKFNNAEKNKVRLLMMNPSYADKNVSDQTTSAAINEFQKNYGSLETINLSPKITTDPDRLEPLSYLENLYNKYYVIDKMTDENYDIVLATGDFRQNTKNKLVKDQMYDTYQELLKNLKYNKLNIRLYAYGMIKENRYGIHFSKAKMKDKTRVIVGWSKDNKEYILKPYFPYQEIVTSL
ncbi:DUF1643 domain-containing protein [Apilactobacillus micheneri]|uniref:DUF1643 domain-containing protein n=1 Tax=Apilactobacillus micheneri TaxID=1899430 RepID=UPI00112B4D73|nr:DUF1643 domain-containing protein [Apilactobacillus micheneri]TPR50774.1 DUF1643 domain-containing protein [Apilactobacillus micheneri]